MVYAGQLNVDLLAALREHRVQAVGLSGVDADLITAHRRPPVQVVDDAGATAQGGLRPRRRHRPGGPARARDADGGAVRARRREPGRGRGRRGVQRQRRHRGRVARGGAPGAEADLPHRRAGRAARPERPVHAGHLRRSRRPRRAHGERRRWPAACGPRWRPASARPPAASSAPTSSTAARPTRCCSRCSPAPGCGTMIVGRKEKATYLGVDLAG